MHMSTRTAKFVSAIFAGLLAGAPFATTSHGATNAADTTCVPGPKGAAPQGGHWYYRIDRATKRHCWYVGDAKQKPARAAPENSQPAADAAAPPNAAIQPSIADARAELPSPQTRVEEAPAITGPQAAAAIANAGQRANALDANAQRSTIASRWPESSGVNSSAGPGPIADNSPAPAPSSATAAPPPAVAPVALVAADSSSQRQASQSQTGSIHMLLAVILGALALAGLMGSAIFRFGSSRRIDPRDMRRGQRPIWDSVRTDSPSRQLYSNSDVPVRRIDMPRELRAADDPDERIAQMLQRLARSAAT
jgi:hypothetical protein